MRLCREVIDFIGRCLFQDPAQSRAIRDVPIVEGKFHALVVRVGVDAVQPLGVERRRAPHDSVHLVTTMDQKFREERAILTGNAGDQRTALSGFLRVSRGRIHTNFIRAIACATIRSNSHPCVHR